MTSDKKGPVVAKAEAVCKLLGKLPASDSLPLHYLLSLSDLIASRINLQSLKEEDLKDIFLTLYQRFGISDIQSAHPNLQKLQSDIVNLISDKESFMVLLVQDFIDSSKAKTVPFDKVVGMVQSQKDLDQAVFVQRLS